MEDTYFEKKNIFHFASFCLFICFEDFTGTLNVVITLEISTCCIKIVYIFLFYFNIRLYIRTEVENCQEGFLNLKSRLLNRKCQSFKQCCGAGAGGAEIIWGPGAGAENKFK